MVMTVTVQLGTVRALPTGAVFPSLSPLQPQSYTKIQIDKNVLFFLRVRWRWEKKKKKTRQEVELMRRGREVSARQLKTCYANMSLQPNLTLWVSFHNQWQNFMQCSPENRMTKKQLQLA